MIRHGRRLREGLDGVMLDAWAPGSGLIGRVDGFVGHPRPIDTDHDHMRSHRDDNRVADVRLPAQRVVAAGVCPTNPVDKPSALSSIAGSVALQNVARPRSVGDASRQP